MTPGTSPKTPFFSTNGTPLASVAMPMQKKEHDHGQVKGWLEAMRSSSPPRYFREAEEDGRQVSGEQLAKAHYEEWVVKHASALHMFEPIMKQARGKQIAVFLDYDGTLSPIVEDPDCAYMSDEMRTTVKEVAANFPTAIITGRRRDKVYEFVHLAELYYAGSHGMDIMGPAEGCNGFKADGLQAKDSKGNDVVLFQPASEYLSLMDEVCSLLKERSKKYRGARVDHNKYCATLHFRCVKEEDWLALAEEVQAILKEYPELTLTQGRKVLELRPAIEWHKGKALEFLIEALGLGNPSKVFPIYIGDDRTDEDAFQVLREKGSSCSILVSKVSKDTCATYSLQDPSQVMQFLQQLKNWKARS
ncbi:hypothetical protein L7F22_018424 [Adiantum nelumboides]|nr:hypothetical protein [Adiantum nelumboides]